MKINIKIIIQMVRLLQSDADDEKLIRILDRIKTNAILAKRGLQRKNAPRWQMVPEFNKDPRTHLMKCTKERTACGVHFKDVVSTTDSPRSCDCIDCIIINEESRQ